MLRIAIAAFARGASPLLAVEYARRSIPVEQRPSFMEMETAIKREARIPPVSSRTQPGGTAVAGHAGAEAHAGTPE